MPEIEAARGFLFSESETRLFRVERDLETLDSGESSQGFIHAAWTGNFA